MIIIFDQSKACKSDETFEHWILSRSIFKVIQGHFDWPVFSRPRMTPTYTIAHVMNFEMHWDLVQDKESIFKIIEIYSWWCVRKYAGACNHFRLELVDIPWGKNTKLARLKIQKDSNLKQFPGSFIKYFLSFARKNKFIRLSFWEIDRMSR